MSAPRLLRLFAALLATSLIGFPLPVQAADAPSRSMVHAPPARPLAATRTWTGDSLVDGKWSTKENWSGDVVPSQDDILVFPSGASRKNNVNDLVTFYGLLFFFRVGQIQIQGGGYTLNGEVVKTNNGYYISGSGTNTVTLGTFFNDATSQSVALPNNSKLILTGNLTGNDDVLIEGGGEVEIAGPNDNAFGGKIKVSNATLTLNKPAGKKATSGPLDVGLSFVPNNVARVEVRASNQLPDDEAITIYPGGVFDLGVAQDAVGTITMYGGTIDMTTNQFLAGVLTPTAGIVITAPTTSALINGTVVIPPSGTVIDTNADAPGGPGLIVNARLRGTGLLTKRGPGTVQISGTNTFTGPISIRGGTLDAASTGALGLAVEEPGITVELTGTLKLSAPISVTRELTLANLGPLPALIVSSTATISAFLQISGTNIISVAQGALLTIDETIIHSGVPNGIRKEGTGTLLFRGASFALGGGSQIYTYTVAAGTMRFGPPANKNLNVIDLVVLKNAALEIDGITIQIRGLYGNGEVRLLGSQALLVMQIRAGEEALYSGTISGPGRIQSIRSGTLTLTGNNTYTGTTFWLSGTLEVANSAGIGLRSEFVILDSQPATLRVVNSSGIGIDARELEIDGCGTIEVNNSGGTGIVAKNRVSIESCSTLTGAGIISGFASVDGILAPGNAGPGTLTMVGLFLTSTARSIFELGSPAGPNDRVQSFEEIRLGGALEIVALPGFGVGIYRLFDYQFNLTNNPMTITNAPVGFDYYIDTTTFGQVNLLVVPPGSPPPIPQPGGGRRVFVPAGVQRYQGGW